MSREKTGTRSRILDCTWRLLETDPARAVRMADIAEAAGVSRQAVYLHFPNRADLLIATTRHIDAMNDVDARLAASRAAATGVERLDAYVEALGDPADDAVAGDLFEEVGPLARRPGDGLDVRLEGISALREKRSSKAGEDEGRTRETGSLHLEVNSVAA